MKLLLTSIVCVLVLSAFAQQVKSDSTDMPTAALHTGSATYKNVKIADLGDDGGRAIPAIAISRKDPLQLTVKGPGSLFFLSKDGGNTWEATDNKSSEGSCMSLIPDAKGVLHTVYVAQVDGRGRIVVAQSRDNGRTWAPPVAVAPSPGEQHFPAATLDVKGNLYITWTETGNTGENGACESVIMMSTSSSGSKWSKPLRVSQAGGGCDKDNKMATGGIPAINPDGKMFISWYNSENIHMDRSFANNMWLENDISITAMTPGWQLAVPGCSQVTAFPQLMVDQSKGTYRGCMYLTWTDQRNGEDDTDVWFMRSNNYGDNWSSPARLGDVSAQKQQYGSRMTVDQITGYVYVLFYDRGAHDDDQTDVTLAYSSESGGSFKTVRISEEPFVPDEKNSAGVYLDITAYNGTVVPVWTRTDGTTASVWTTTIRQDELIKRADQPKAKKKK